MRLLLLLISFSILEPVASQYQDSARLYQFPVRNSMAYTFDTTIHRSTLEPNPVISLEADSDSVFHFRTGKVLSVFRLGDEVMAVVIEEVPGEYLIYSNIRTANLKKGDLLKKGDFVGLMSRDGRFHPYQMDILFRNGEKDVSSERTLALLKTVNDF